VFYLNVAYVYNDFKCFSIVFISVPDACFKCFICLHIYVASVASGCFKNRPGVASLSRLLLPRLGISSYRCGWASDTMRTPPLPLFSILVTFVRRGPPHGAHETECRCRRPFECPDASTTIYRDRRNR
jgi:hypothetical protein